MKPNLTKALLGGFAGTIAMTMMMKFVAPFMLGKPMDVAHLLAEFLGGPWILGMLIHFALGSLVFPVAYVFVLYAFLPGPPTLKGVLWGILLWVAAMAVTMPILGQGFFMSQTLGLKGAMAAFMAHLLYGAVFGVITGKVVNHTQDIS